MIRPRKLHRIIYSLFPKSKHNLIDTMTSFDVILTSYWWNFIFPQSEKYLNTKVTDKIKKLANKLIIFTNSNNVMMMLFIVKEVSGIINLLESAAILNYEMYSIFLGTRTNGGNRYRKIDLCIKGCLKSKKSGSCEIPREIFTVKNWTKHLPCVHFKVLFYLKLTTNNPELLKKL